jgi:hypothetical protein
MATERTEETLAADLGIDCAAVPCVPQADPEVSRDPLFKKVLVLEAMVDRIFPREPMFIHLPFDGGSIDVLRAPTKETVTTLTIDECTSRFGLAIGAHGRIGSISHGELRGTNAIPSVIRDLAEATSRIQQALVNPAEGSFVVYKPISQSTAGR